MGGHAVHSLREGRRSSPRRPRLLRRLSARSCQFRFVLPRVVDGALSGIDSYRIASSPAWLPLQLGEIGEEGWHACVVAAVRFKVVLYRSASVSRLTVGTSEPFVTWSIAEVDGTQTPSVCIPTHFASHGIP